MRNVGGERARRWNIVEERRVLAVGQFAEPREIATDTEAAIAREIACTIEHRQSGQFHRQALTVIVHRPVQRDAAPGFAGRYGFCDEAVRIQIERLDNLMPWPTEFSGGMRTDQSHEIIGAEQEAAVGVHLPDETDRLHCAQWRRNDGRWGGLGVVSDLIDGRRFSLRSGSPDIGSVGFIMMRCTRPDRLRHLDRIVRRRRFGSCGCIAHRRVCGCFLGHRHRLRRRVRVIVRIDHRFR